MVDFALMCFCLFFVLLLFSEQKDQFHQVIRHADQTSLPVQMASVSRKHGTVTTMMIVETARMKCSAVSFIFVEMFFFFLQLKGCLL